MTQDEYKAIVDDAVKNGAKREDAEAHVRAGFKLNEETHAFAFGSRADGGKTADGGSAKPKKAKAKK